VLNAYGNSLEIIGYEIDLKIKRNGDYKRHIYNPRENDLILKRGYFSP